MNREREIEKKAGACEGVVKKIYTKPALVELGKIAHLTMGSQDGTGESGNPFVFRPS